MRLVIDSSVAIEICLAGGRPGPLAGHELHAPALLASEVPSVLRELAFRGEIADGQGREALSHLDGLGVELAPAGSLALAAYDFSGASGWAKTYDAEYVGLADTLECPLVTSDGRLARGAAAHVRVLAPMEVPTA
jgi:predicted nucleic acid-binding protein